MGTAGGGAIRIIAGAWRGTRIRVTASKGLRPTPNRVRETVFNWLRTDLPGARCLDLFAGTGALGFEAVSRGAASCDLIERERPLVDSLTELKNRLRANSIAVHHGDALQWLKEKPRRYDIVFIDPPFNTVGLAPLLDKLLDGWVAHKSKVYVEVDKDGLITQKHWQVLKQGATRDVNYALLQYRR